MVIEKHQPILHKSLELKIIMYVWSEIARIAFNRARIIISILLIYAKFVTQPFTRNRNYLRERKKAALV